ncbi:MAG: 16S rRNA (cytosine(1402)-N(4))-methyltransferase RsmH [Mycoplasmoidaceae bacterium]
MSSNIHKPVFLKEAISLLKVNNYGKYLDCTFGRGGHSRLILDLLKNDGFLWMIDCDNDAAIYAKENFKNLNACFIKDKFGELYRIAVDYNINNLDGILFDLGVSSPQLDEKERGFSYHGKNVLDMRMDQNQKFSAINLLADYPKEKLSYIFKKYGEIKFPNYVVDAIVESRKKEPIIYSNQLVDIIKSNVNRKELFKKKHPARLYFQAIRIEINQELEQLENAIFSASKLLNTKGRIVIITFHSLEEKIVKDVFRKLSINEIPKEIPVVKNISQKFKIIKHNYKIFCDSNIENRRERSAKIWCLEKCYE